jgi:hypothetical protein
VDVKLQHLNSDIKSCDALEIMTVVYVCMTCKNSTAICITLAVTLGLQLRIPLTPPTIAVPSDSSRANRAKLVVLQGRITGRKKISPSLGKSYEVANVHTELSGNTHAECAPVHTTAYRNTIQPQVYFTHSCTVRPVR